MQGWWCHSRSRDGLDAAGYELHTSAALEGCADFFLGTPIEENPYASEYRDGWCSWLEGWLWGSMFKARRGELERARWAA
jgi:hypothetical protein